MEISHTYIVCCMRATNPTKIYIFFVFIMFSVRVDFLCYDWMRPHRIDQCASFFFPLKFWLFFVHSHIKKVNERIWTPLWPHIERGRGKNAMTRCRYCITKTRYACECDECVICIWIYFSLTLPPPRSVWRTETTGIWYAYWIKEIAMHHRQMRVSYIFCLLPLSPSLSVLSFFGFVVDGRGVAMLSCVTHPERHLYSVTLHSFDAFDDAERKINQKMENPKSPRAELCKWNFGFRHTHAYTYYRPRPIHAAGTSHSHSIIIIIIGTQRTIKMVSCFWRAFFVADHRFI